MNTNSTAALSYDNMNDAHPLYVRSPSGRYRPVTDDQILAAGRVAAESLISTANTMMNPGQVAKFFQSKLAGLGHECAAFLYLDSQLKPIRYIEQAMGTLSHASIYPREIEEKILAHPGIHEAAVVGVPDPVWGEVGVAVCVAKADFPVTAAELEDWLKERIARYKLPKRFLFWSELPKSGYGKITKKDIRERLAAAGEA